MFTRYGYKTFGTIIISVIIIFVLAYFIHNPYIQYSFYIIGSFFLIFSANFFRDPKRTSPPGDNFVVSPADGKVLSISEIDDKRFLNGPAYQISIFMSPLNVHVNRIPIDGNVEYLQYHEGEYLVAYHDKADERNERNEIGINSKFGKVLFTQVAGYVARRIVSELKKGQEVKIGERFGMIKFGSRCDVIVSKEWTINVKVDDIVKAAESILYKYEK